jgi:rod shape-determining protein MreC
MRRAGAGRRIPAGVLLAIVLVVGALALVIVQAGRNGGLGQVAQQTGDGAAGAAGRVATGPARAGEGFLSRIIGMWNATARVEELEAENRDLQTWREMAERLAERNARYEALLRMPPDQFGDGADIENSIAAQLVLDSGGPFTRTLVANAGADHGVRIGYIAVNENGLIGRVVSVGARSARILMLDDYNSRIPVMGEASRVRAVLAGQATRPPDLYTHPFQMQAPRLDFIVGAQSLREGERVVTSGDGGLYPRGIPVGVARASDDGHWRVALAASQRPIDFVRILPFIGGERPEASEVDDTGPPLSASSSVAAIGREVTTPPPTAPSATAPPRPRPAATTMPAAATTPPRRTPAPTPATEILAPIEIAPIAPQVQPEAPPPASPEPQE